MTWSLSYNNVTAPLHHWGISNLQRSRFNQGQDKLSFSIPKSSLDSPLPFPPESLITLLKDNSPCFHGIVTATPLHGSPSNESLSYQISGPWWFLENLIYQQPWPTPPPQDSPDSTPSSKFSTRIILGQSPSGSPLHNGQQIRDILNFAISQSAPIQIGSIDVDTFIPLDETKDLTCAEAIQRLLRWSPDAVLWFDYSTSPTPTLHISKRSSMPAFNLDILSHPIQNLKITPRYDLQCPAVLIHYEKNHSSNGRSYSTIDRDSAPASFNPDSAIPFKTLALTIELDGSRSHTLSQKITSAPIELDSLSWWKLHLPYLQNIPDSAISIKSPSRSSSLPYELLEGNIAPWMPFHAEQDTIRALISFQTPSQHIIDREVTIKIHVTNAPSNSYSHSLTSSPSEPTPSGLAQKLFQALNPLQFEGHFSLIHQELPSSNFLGSTLNILNSNPQWSSMHTLIQSVHENLSTGSTHITFGPPKHLGPDDLIEILRINRRRSASKNADKRSFLKSSPTPSHLLHQPTHSRFESIQHTPGQFVKLSFHHPSNPSSQIVLDPSSLPPNLSINLQEDLVCENGQLKKRLLLASSPLPLES